ncbi:MAG TPA: sulfatase-like hydrolase/transferase, partial [Kofleriaceae bacterium]
MPAKWRAFVPARGAWWRLVAAASSYVLLVALALTMIAKLRVVRGADGVDFWLGRWLAVCAADVVWFCTLAAACAFAERYSRLVQLITIPVAVIVATCALINAGYLSISGEQLSPAVIALGVERINDVGRILDATLFARPLPVAACTLVLAAIPVLAWWRLRPAWRESAQLRAHAAATSAAFALVVMLIAPRSQEYGVARLDETAVPRTLWGLVRGDAGGTAALFAGYVPRDLVDKSAIEQLRAGARPNVVLVILESVRRDEITLASPTAPARAPNLLALAARGLELTNARAVVPHTTKSVWSMLCGRLPLMQTAIYEASSTIDAQCVPEILDAAGWRTGFFQSAIGTFEHRPRLVRRLGFRHFVAAEHISNQITGYLASDDQTLLDPVTRWIDEQPNAPFMVTVLTSGTHHPYALPPAVAARVRAEGSPGGTDRERYHRLVENQDVLLGGIVRALEQRGLLERTIIVVLGDHG